MQLSRIPTLMPTQVARLEEAGVSTIQDLLAADPAVLGSRMGLDAGEVRYIQEAARRGWEEAAESTPVRPAPAGAGPAAGAPERVVLRDDAPTARVLVDGKRFEDVPILIARNPDSEARLRESLKEDGVLLKEKSDTATVRVAGAWWDGLPLFKERVGSDGSRGEVRVRVDEIRERRTRREVPAEGGEKRSFLKRLFGK